MIKLHRKCILQAKAELAAARSINKESGKDSEESGGKGLKKKEDPMLAALKQR